jgi:hypothetical protein
MMTSSSSYREQVHPHDRTLTSTRASGSLF